MTEIFWTCSSDFAHNPCWYLAQYEKSNKIDRYNLTVYVNIYHEENASIPYIVEKAMQNMDEENLVLVGPNGMILYRQVGTGA